MPILPIPAQSHNATGVSMTPAQAAEEERLAQIRMDSATHFTETQDFLIDLIDTARRERDEALEHVRVLTAKMEKLVRSETLSESSKPMQPNLKFCHHPEKCRGLGACPREFACND